MNRITLKSNTTNGLVLTALANDENSVVVISDAETMSILSISLDREQMLDLHATLAKALGFTD